jgi:quinolinate synthase
MKLNTLRKVYDCLLHESPEIKVPKKVAEKAIIPIKRMLELSKK